MKLARYSTLIFVTMCACLFTAMPLVASAHEVYVLTPLETAVGISLPSPNPFSAISSHELLFLGWGAVTAVLFLLVLNFSLSRFFERIFDPFLSRLKRFAPIVGRMTLGIGLMASGYFGAFFGPEIPISHAVSPAWAGIVSILVMCVGFCITIGLLTRLMSLIGLAFFSLLIFEDRAYMLTYLNYFGEIVLVAILGGGMFSVDRVRGGSRSIERYFKSIKSRLEPYSFFILRICFGVAVFYASFYAKFLHSNLALQTVSDYHLTNYFPFTPLFLVLGAFIVEALLGLCFMFGFEVRFAALVFTCFLTMSILFFGESVWPHLILFGVNIVIFLHGYDKYTLEMALFQRKRKGEPVL